MVEVEAEGWTMFGDILEYKEDIIVIGICMGIINEREGKGGL
jgi:hypothetical protein